MTHQELKNFGIEVKAEREFPDPYFGNTDSHTSIFTQIVKETQQITRGTCAHTIQ